MAVASGVGWVIQTTECLLPESGHSWVQLMEVGGIAGDRIEIGGAIDGSGRNRK